MRTGIINVNHLGRFLKLIIQNTAHEWGRHRSFGAPTLGMSHHFRLLGPPRTYIFIDNIAAAQGGRSGVIQGIYRDIYIYIYILIYKIIGFLDFSLIWQLGGPRQVKNVSFGSTKNFHYRKAHSENLDFSSIFPDIIYNCISGLFCT